jgi:hypothetical protein
MRGAADSIRDGVRVYLRDARRARILQSRSFIGPGQWLVVLVLYFHVLLLISTVHIKRSASMAVALWMFSSAFTICFVLLLMYDRPFPSGGLTVGPVGIEATVVGVIAGWLPGHRVALVQANPDHPPDTSWTIC